MKGSECRLIEYMEGSKKRFIIPVYQRNYDWKTENCKQLYDDLIKVIKHNRRSHFFGTRHKHMCYYDSVESVRQSRALSERNRPGLFS